MGDKGEDNDGMNSILAAAMGLTSLHSRPAAEEGEGGGDANEADGKPKATEGKKASPKKPASKAKKSPKRKKAAPSMAPGAGPYRDQLPPSAMGGMPPPGSMGMRGRGMGPPPYGPDMAMGSGGPGRFPPPYGPSGNYPMGGRMDGPPDPHRGHPMYRYPEPPMGMGDMDPGPPYQGDAMDLGPHAMAGEPSSKRQKSSWAVGLKLDADPNGSANPNPKAHIKHTKLPSRHDYQPQLDDDSPPALSFPETLYQVICDPANEDIIHWLPHGKGFVVRDKDRFGDEILPTFFDGAKFTSFTRRLKRWHFERIPRGPEMGAYYHKSFMRGRPDMVLNMIYGRDGDEAMDEESRAATEAKRKEVSEKRRKRYKKKAEGDMRDEAVVAAAMEAHRQSKRAEEGTKAMEMGREAEMELGAPAGGRGGEGTMAEVPYDPSGAYDADPHAGRFGLRGKKVPQQPSPKKNANGKRPPFQNPTDGSLSVFCVCGNTMSGKEKRCAECSKFRAEKAKDAYEAPSNEYWVCNACGNECPATHSRCGMCSSWKGGKMLQALQEQRDFRHGEEVQRLQRLDPARRAAEMELALERRKRMPESRTIPDHVRRQMEMEIRQSEMEMMHDRRHRGGLPVISPPDIEKQQAQMMSEIPYPMLPHAGGGGGMMYNDGGGRSGMMGYAGGNEMASAGGGGMYGNPARMPPQGGMMNKMMASNKAHEEIMMMAAQDLQTRTRGSSFDGPPHMAMQPPRPHPPMRPHPMDDEEMAIRELERRASAQRRQHQQMMQPYPSQQPYPQQPYSQQQYPQPPQPSRAGYPGAHARMLAELEDKVEQDMMLRRLEEKVERDQAAARMGGYPGEDYGGRNN